MHCEPAIALRGVAKKFRLFASQRDRLFEALWPKRMRHTEFWALRDIDLVVPRGQTIGILGRNGSGKSTLLQLLAGIFPPSAGDVVVNGRVSALLELGAGFNPEFSGRDNVLMNGLLRGLSPGEMRVRMPEIEAFADVGDFFDRPVKTYSSGMFVRVAFAAAINVDPDILLVDEALAVGDVKFQHKCFNAIRAMQRRGVTIVIVTHDIQAVVNNCQRAMVLNFGQIVELGPPKAVTDRFYAMMMGFDTSGAAVSRERSGDCVPCRFRGDAAEPSGDGSAEGFGAFSASSEDLCHENALYNRNEVRFGNREAAIIDYAVLSCGQKNPLEIASGSVVEVVGKVRFGADVSGVVYGMNLKSRDGIYIYGTNTELSGFETKLYRKGEITCMRMKLQLNVNAGDFFMTLGVAKRTATALEFLDSRQGLIHLRVKAANSFDGLVDLGLSFSETRLGSPA